MKKSRFLILAASCLTIICSSAVGAAAVTGTSQTSYISTEEAKSIALKHAGLTDSEAVWVTARLERDDGRMIYDIEFWMGSQEYDYELDAYTGEILACDYDIEGGVVSNSESTISPDEAKAIALERAGLSGDQVRFIAISYEYEDGLAVYQIDFISDSTEYEIEINANDGTVIEYDAESRHTRR